MSIPEKLKSLVRLALALPKTIIFNFRYLPLREALKLPFLISHNVVLRKLGGRVHVRNPSLFSIRIGFGDVGIFDKELSRSVWCVGGTVEFLGVASIGHGSKISVDGLLTIGNNFHISAESSICVKKSVIIGNDVLVSWDVLIMDTDFHVITDENGVIINEDDPIFISDNVWIGCRSLILKGVTISFGTVIAAGAIVSKSITKPNCIVAGVPAKTVRDNIFWKP